MKPINQNVLVKPFEAINISEGGIIVPDSAKRMSNKMLVVEVGNGCKAQPMKLKKGDIGFQVKNWAQTGGTEVYIDNELHYIMNQRAIIALQ